MHLDFFLTVTKYISLKKSIYEHKNFLWHYISIFLIVGGVSIPIALKIL